MVGEPASDDSIPSLAARLVDEGKQFARAEVQLVRARIAPRIAGGRNAAICAAVALSLAHAVLVALLVGLILVVSNWIGIGGAVAAVVIGGLLIVALLGWLAYGQAKKAFGSKDSR